MNFNQAKKIIIDTLNDKEAGKFPIFFEPSANPHLAQEHRQPLPALIRSEQRNEVGVVTATEFVYKLDGLFNQAALEALLMLMKRHKAQIEATEEQRLFPR